MTVDELIGLRVRLIRIEARLSQEELADKLGTTFQQIQKFERGNERIPATTLVKIAVALGIKPTFFFHGLANFTAQPLTDLSLENPLELADALSALYSPELRAAALALVREIAVTKANALSVENSVKSCISNDNARKARPSS